jgi:7,8-dihydropterin-6-yl-methyl-4-(beta-D-ribofuranosyl)aminobenzene 5'-phosphate synthase
LIFQADRLEIRVLVENWIDMLLPDRDLDPGGEVAGDCVTRWGLIEHFDPALTPPQAENGISLLVTAHKGRQQYTVLFDAGLTGTVLAHNLAALAVDPNSIQHVVISHGHPDHYGGVHRFLDLLDHPVPVATHSDAFLPRYAVMADGRVSSFYNQAFTEASLYERGGAIIKSSDAAELGCGLFLTGEIRRELEFEAPTAPAIGSGGPMSRPGLYQVRPSGEIAADLVMDEQALVADVRGKGLVVLTGCAHAGVINTIQHAQRLAGEEKVFAVLGGFHLGFPTTPTENVEKTTSALRDLDIGLIMPMHCSGLRAHQAISTGLPERYVQPAVGTTLRFGR